jgi:hypothetical protein
MTFNTTGGFGWTNPDLEPNEPEPGHRPKHSPLLVVIGLGVLIIAAWFVLTVLGGKGSGNLNPIAQAAQRTSDVSGVRFRFGGSGAIPQLPTTVTMQGVGVFDFDDDSGQMTVSGAFPAPVGEMRFDFVFSGDTIYMASPQMASFLPAGKSWIGTEVSGADQNSASDPHAVLEQLEAISSQITNVGEERIRGVITTHYQATTSQDGVQVPVDAWIDRHGLLRRLQESANAATGGGLAISIDFYDYGYKPQVVVPPSDEVISAEDLGQSFSDQLSQ